MASRLLDGCTGSTDYEDATITASGSQTFDLVQITFDNTSDPEQIDAAIGRAIAIITQHFQNIA